MRRRVGVPLATIILLFFVLAAYRTRTAAAQEDDKQAAINVVLAHEVACQAYDFDKLDSLHTPDSRGIESPIPSHSNPTHAKATKPTRTLASISTTTPKTQWRRCEAMLHGSP